MISTTCTQLVQLCFPGFLCFVFLTAFVAADRTFPARTLNMFMAAILSGFLLMTADSVNFYFQDQQTHNTLRLFMLACSFTFKIAVSSVCVAISQRSFPKIRKILYSLIAVNAVLSFISIPTGCVFYIADDFTVGHGALYFVSYLIILHNCTVLMIGGIRQFRSNPGETVVIIAMIVFPSVATFMEVGLHMRLMLPFSFICCVVFYFMCLNVQLYRRDTLTLLLNRRSFYMDAKRHMKKYMVVLSMDLNNLKTFNDTEGHAAGDIALKTAVSCMHQAFSKIGTVYRTGGDEFMALFISKKEEVIVEAVKKFQKILSETKYRVACGFYEYKPGDDFEKCVAGSDERMYRNKQLMKMEKEAKYEYLPEVKD